MGSESTRRKHRPNRPPPCDSPSPTTRPGASQPEATPQRKRHFGVMFPVFPCWKKVVSCQNYGYQLWKKNTALMWFDVQLLHSNSLASCLWTGRDIQLKDMSGERKLVEPVLETSADPYDPRNNVSSKQTQQRFLVKCKIRKICST